MIFEVYSLFKGFWVFWVQPGVRITAAAEPPATRAASHAALDQRMAQSGIGRSR